jgi:glutamate-1-semialdehyde 2,1-aminomutase
MFLCAAMTPADIEQVLDAADASFKALKVQAPTLEPVAKMSFLTA